MNSLSKLCIAGLACLVTAGAQAAVVSYRYTATIDTLVEKNLATGGYDILTESAFPGFPLKRGDVVKGTFSYDTVAKLSTYQPRQQAGSQWFMYDTSSGDYMNYLHAPTGHTVRSDPALAWLGTIQVHDGGESRPDFFSMTMRGWNTDFFYSSRLFLWNPDGAAFPDASVPARLDSSLFSYMTMGGSFMHMNDDGWMEFSATLTSLEQVGAEIPEPGAGFLLVAGAAGLVAARRRARRIAC